MRNDLKELKDSPSDSIPGFNDRLIEWLPTMIEHRCSIGERGGFFQRLRDGTYPAHILGYVAIESSRRWRNAGLLWKALRETSEDGVYKVVMRYRDEQLARACLFAGRELILAAVYNRPYDVGAEVKKLQDLADRVCLGPSTAAIVRAAEARGIPARRLNSGSLVQLGQGIKQRRIWTAETDRTSAIAESIAQDKELTKTLLRAGGIPVPAGRIVNDVADAWEAASEVGLPVVVKPRDANHARGVSVNLTTREQVEEAFQVALQWRTGVIVETPGETSIYCCLSEIAWWPGLGANRPPSSATACETSSSSSPNSSTPIRGAARPRPFHSRRSNSSQKLCCNSSGKVTTGSRFHRLELG